MPPEQHLKMLPEQHLEMSSEQHLELFSGQHLEMPLGQHLNMPLVQHLEIPLEQEMSAFRHAGMHILVLIPLRFLFLSGGLNTAPIASSKTPFSPF